MYNEALGGQRICLKQLLTRMRIIFVDNSLGIADPYQWILLKEMVAYDEPGLVPIKRTLQKIDYQNQVCKELEVSHERLKNSLCYVIVLALLFFSATHLCL